jgi:hypothetical protein
MKALSLALVFLFLWNCSNSLAQKDWDFGVMASLGLGYRVFQSDIPGLKKLRNKTDYAAFNYTYGLTSKLTFQKKNAVFVNFNAGTRGFQGDLTEQQNTVYDQYKFRRIIKVFTLDLMYNRKLEAILSSPWVGLGIQGSYYRNQDYKLIVEQIGYHWIARPNFGLIANVYWNLDIFKRSSFDIGVFGYVDFRSNRDIEPILDQAKIWFSGCSAFVKYYF